MASRLAGPRFQSVLSSRAAVLIGWGIGCASSWPSRAWKKLRSARRWQSADPLIDRRVQGQGRRGDRARRPDRAAEIGTQEVAGDSLDGAEEEGLVPLDRSAERPAELLAMKIRELAAVRQVAGQPLEPLEMEDRAVHVVRARLRDDVDHAARRPAELGGRAAGDHLEFLHGVQGDVDGSALSPDLLAEEAIVEIAAVEAEIVEHAPLPGEGDLVAVGPLHHAHARRQRQQIFELASENRRVLDRGLIQRAGDRRAGRLHQRGPAHRDGLRDIRHRQPGREIDRLAHGQIDAVLDDGAEAGDRERHLVSARRQLQEHEAAIGAGGPGLCEVGLEVHRFDADPRDDRAGRILDRPLDDPGRDLRLSGQRHRGTGNQTKTNPRNATRIEHLPCVAKPKGGALGDARGTPRLLRGFHGWPALRCCRR